MDKPENQKQGNIPLEYYKTIVQTGIDGTWVVDMEGHFLEVNNAYCKLVGYSRDEVLKMKISDIEAIEKPEDVRQRIEKVMKTGGDRFETRHRRKDGSIIEVEVSVNYTKDEGGRLFVFVRDITDRKKDEGELKKVKDELQARVEEMEKFNKLVVGRELAMAKLKEENAELKKRLEEFQGGEKK
jgi:PAS domain S-box-containing protein